ncbi:DsbA family protein [Corynebacterium pelargi]|uniref:DSBA-like thioredoxin domain protein n=1 Tax=Corynebacterium pelargi TaxID=1471400 RepID=A0A410W793_9CORY|nr:DsbA family protein [Corynebacterium pelargi]QAU51820.1 DSBA-like thioredoxin domain protein [Corynebacterium pelargi]GGG72248.1 DSBA oxidoreductase [Corynebacterium pelargi]
MSEKVTFWFDATCPFCWITSRWMKEVEQVRDVQVQWVPMSLGVLNEGREELPEAYREHIKAAWGPARVATIIALQAPDRLDDYYTAIGTKLHNEGQGGRSGFGAYDDVIAATLDELGLDPSFAQVANTQDVDKQMRDFHQQAMDAVGNDVGTPVLKLGDAAFFGPVLTRIPKGEEAGKLFDASVTLGNYPHFFELKRSRTEDPQFDA